jgi:hypothetical protein
MSYIVPSVQVQQQIVNSGGVSTNTPNLDACIIGPAYNILGYVPGSLTSQVKTAASSTVSTTGSISNGFYLLTVVSTGGLLVGSVILVSGAGASGGVLQATILGIAGNVITLDTAASTTVVGAVVALSAVLTNPAVDNTYVLPGQLPGQIIDPTTVRVWMSNTLVDTLTSGFLATPNSNVITMATAATTGSITSTHNSLTVASAANLEIGDSISIVGAGTSGSTLTAVISGIVGTTITISVNAVTSVVGGVVTKVIPSNLNSTTNTLNVVAGAKVLVTYVDNSAVSHIFTSSVLSVATSSGLNGTINSINLADTLPSSTVLTSQTVYVVVQQIFNDQQIPATNPLTSAPNLNISTVGTTGTITIKVGVSLIFGPIVSGSVYVAYNALRTDLSGAILTINNEADLLGQLVDVTDSNPLGLAVQTALANTTGRVRAIAIPTNDLAGHLEALTVAQGEQLYFLVPLTQDPSIIATYKAHCDQMSTPQNAAWRMVIANTAIPLTMNVGTYSLASPNSNSGANATTLVGSSYVLTASNATFISDGVVPGDVINFTAATATPSQVGSWTVLTVISNQQLVISTTATATAISYYISRNMSRSQSASAVAAVSSQFNDQRVVHVQPDVVGLTVNGVTKYLPGYYLAAGLAGMGTGFPVQQGFTNVGIAGIVDLQHSNFFFAKADLNTMAAAGTCLFVQDTQGGVPYVRHELTTNMTTLNSREILMVKELDYLSYFYYSILKGFIGSWNITPASLNTLRQTITAGSELIISQSLPKIGPVLLSYKIATLAQDAVNTDTVDCTMTLSIGTPMNYIDLTLSV